MLQAITEELKQKENYQLQLITYDVTAKTIAELSEKFANLKIVDSDTAAYKLVTGGISTVKTLRVNVEKRRKELKKSAIEFGKKVDSTAKQITQQLLTIEEPLKALKKQEDDRKAAIKAEKDRIEKKRVEEINLLISDMKNYPLNHIESSSEELTEVIAQLGNVPIAKDIYQEFYIEGLKTKKEAKESLEKILSQKLEMEAKQAKLEVERKEQAELQLQQEEQAELRRKEQKIADEKQAEELKSLNDQKAQLVIDQKKVAEETALLSRGKETEQEATPALRGTEKPQEEDTQKANEQTSANVNEQVPPETIEPPLTAKEVLEAVEEYVQGCRETGNTDHRCILHYIQSLYKRCGV